MDSQQIKDRADELFDADKAFFDGAFNDMNVPADIRRASERICRAYNIRGISDPGYIANVFALETGRGDGAGNFNS